MINELNSALAEYFQKWQTLVKGAADPGFLGEASPTALGWKTKDHAEYDARYKTLLGQSDKVYSVWLNERWLTTFHLKNSSLEGGITLVKLMQRRPGSSDPIGLDHVDFYHPMVTSAADLLSNEPDLDCQDEANGLCAWVSVHFEGTEAKLRRETVLDIAVAELQQLNEEVMAVTHPAE